MNTAGIVLDTESGASDAELVCQTAVEISSSVEFPKRISAIERVCDMRGSRSQTLRRYLRFAAKRPTVKGHTVAVDGTRTRDLLRDRQAF